MTFEAFLKIEGVNGESPIRLESFSWGVSNSGSVGTGGGSGSGKASFQDFAFTAQVGKQSPQLFETAATGKILRQAILMVTDRAEPLKITFKDLLITNYKLDEGSNSSNEGALQSVRLGAPIESVSFAFTSVEFEAGGSMGMFR